MTHIPKGGLARAAARGTSLTTAQVVVNKIATLVSMWVVAYELGPDELGMGWLALQLGLYLVLLPPLTVGDVLVAHQRRFGLVAPAARRMAIVAGVASSILIACVAPLLSKLNPQYPPATLTVLLWVIAWKPIGDALCPITHGALRRDLRYGTLALIDGTIQLTATAATVTLAVCGAGALAIVLPQVVAMFIKAVSYWRWARHDTTPHAVPPWVARHISRTLWREFLLAGSAQYAHNVVVGLPVVILGYLSTEEETGRFAFAFLLSAQANGLIASQLGTVLQPIFGRLGHDPARQADGFLRVLRTLGAVAVPVTLLQGALGKPIFDLAFDARWQPAILIFSLLSVLESFYFATAPTMSLLRAQRRFGAYFAWQVSHLVVAAVVLALVAPRWGGLGVAIATLACWVVSLPVAVWVCGRPARLPVGTVMRVFFAPWTAALPVAGATWLLANWLCGQGAWGGLAALLIVGPVALVVCIGAIRWTQPAAWADLAPMAARLRRRPPAGSRPSVAVVQHFYPHYRRAVLEALAASEVAEFTFIGDDHEYLRSIEPATLGPGVRFELAPTHRMGGPFMWQWRAFTIAFDRRFDTIIFHPVPHWPCTWLGAIAARVMGKRVLFWGHGWLSKPRGSKGLARRLLLGLPHGHLLYGRIAKGHGVALGWDPAVLHVLHNSLDLAQQQEVRASLTPADRSRVRTALFGDASLPVVNCTSRMIPMRKLDQLVRAMALLRERGRPAALLLVGDGPERGALERLASDLMVPTRFEGACYDERRIAERLWASNVTVVPGRVGLTAIHSLAYGVPVVSHDDPDDQAPEWEAILPGVTGAHFRKDSIESLADAIEPWIVLAEPPASVRQACIGLIERSWNPGFQRTVIERAVCGAPADDTDA